MTANRIGRVLMAAVLGIVVLAIGAGCDWTTVQGQVCPAHVCPAPTVDEAVDVLIQHGMDVILGDDESEDG